VFVMIGESYLAFGYLSFIKTKSSSYSITLPSLLTSGDSTYIPSPLRGSQPFITFLTFFRGPDGDIFSAVGLGFLDDMSSVTIV
jgi:hypothetical protein